MATKVKIRNKKCTDCKLHRGVDQVCEVGYGPPNAKIMVVGKMPNSSTYKAALEADLKEVGIDPVDVYFTAALKCRQFELNVSRLDIKACSKYLEAEIAAVQPEWILATGNEALQALTGHSGITKYRSRVIERSDIRIIPTISPAAALRNPGQRGGWLTDLRFFAAQVFEKSSKIPKPKMHYIDTKAKFKKLQDWLGRTELISYDIETFSTPQGDEFAKDAAIVSLSGTCLLDDGSIKVWAIPLFHPQSPFRNNWQQALRILARLLSQIKKQIAHNGKYDARWLRHFGVPMRVTFDTMLACHLLDENRSKGLKPQATSRFGVPPWGVDTKNLLAMPIEEVLEYNCLDTYYTYHLYLETRQELIEQPRLLRIFVKITTKANNILIDVERHGVWTDRERLQTEQKRTLDMRDAIDEQLMEWVPTGEFDELVDLGWPTQGGRGRKLMEVNFNPSNFARWLLFEYLGLPVLERGKEKDDESPGDPSMKEAVMMALKATHPIVPLMLERARLQKMSTFFAAYERIIDDEDRIRTTFKLAGTVTGRLSSGKADADKITGKTSDIRGVNLQQVPRDPAVRGLFGAPPPKWLFVEADFSQVELRVVTFISREPYMLHLYQTGQDIHRITASQTLGVPADQVTKDDRKKAKAVNFGFVYGMGWRKFIATAFEKYELIFTEQEAQDIRRAFFQQFPGLIRWHARQRRLVNEHARVVSPIGRIRHLPDILSGDQGVRAEAERQAINSPVQSFASDMTQLSMILIHEEFKRQGLRAHILGSVHDALLFEIHRKDARAALPIIKGTMENLPLQQIFGVDLDVPIIADLKVGTHWGTARELEAEEVFDYQGEPK